MSPLPAISLSAEALKARYAAAKTPADKEAFLRSLGIAVNVGLASMFGGSPHQALDAAFERYLASLPTVIETTVLSVHTTPTRTGGTFTVCDVDHTKIRAVITFDETDVLPGDFVRFSGTEAEYKGVAQLRVGGDGVEIIEEDRTPPEALARLRNTLREARPYHFDDTLSGFCITSRPGEAEVVIGLFAHQREAVEKFDFIRVSGPDALKVDVDAALRFGAGVIAAERWGDRTVRVFEPSSVALVPFVPKAEYRIEGVDAATCRRLAKHLGPNYAARIVDEPALLTPLIRSSDKRRIVLNAAKVDIAARNEDEAGDERALVSFCAAGARPSKAREIVAASTDLTRNPFEPLYRGDLSHKTCARFAQIFNPAMAAIEGDNAKVVAALASIAEAGDTIASFEELARETWKNYAVTREATGSALETLINRSVVARVRLAGGEFFGWKVAVDAERAITGFLETAACPPLREAQNAIVERVIDHPGEYIGRPGLVLDDRQKAAVRAIFANPASVIAGPPGSGKSTLISVAHVIARALWGKDEATPAQGVALAGRAAQALRLSASIRRPKGATVFPASTIHKAYFAPVQSEAAARVARDGERGPRGRSGIVHTGMLVVDESSMLNARLMALVHDPERSRFRRMVLVGDPEQLPPIGEGAPFTDIIARGLAPVTYLDRNYRAECPALHDINETVRSIADEKRPPSLERIAKGGGLAFVPVENKAARPGVVAGLWRSLIERGVSPFDAAVLFPKQAGESGLKKLNAAIRRALGFGSAIEPGDVLLCVSNDYRAVTKDGGTTTILNGERAEVVKRCSPPMSSRSAALSRLSKVRLPCRTGSHGVMR